MRIALLSLVLLVFGASLHAAPTASLDRRELLVGDVVNYTITHTSRVEPVGLPSSDNDGILMLHTHVTSTTSQQRVDSRGVQQSRFTISWQFRARGEGEFRILPFTVIADGREHVLPEITGSVRASRADGNDGQPVTADRNLELQLREQYFTRLEVSDSNPVPGQPVVLRTYLYRIDRRSDMPYHFVSIGNVQFDPMLLLVENSMRQQSELRYVPVEEDGERWLRALMHEATVVPTRSGRVKVEGPETVISLSRTGVRDPFGRVGLQFQVTRPIAELVVAPAPAMPGDAVSQVVGNVTVGVTADQTELIEGDLMTLTVRFSGEGYLATAGLPGFPSIDGLSLVNEDSRFNISQLSPTLVSTKEIRRTYQALRPGSIRIPAMNFGVVSPETKSAEIQSSLPIVLDVKPSPRGSVQLSTEGPGTVSRAGVIVFDRRGIDYIDTGALSARTLDDTRRPMLRTPGFWIAHGVALAGAVGIALFLGIAQHRLSRESDTLQYARRESREAMQRAWAHAGTDQLAFHMALGDALRAAATGALGYGVAGLTTEQVVVDLQEAGVAPSDARSLGDLIEQCDAARYAPVGGGAHESSKLTEAERLVDVLVRHGARSAR